MCIVPEQVPKIRRRIHTVAHTAAKFKDVKHTVAPRTPPTLARNMLRASNDV